MPYPVNQVLFLDIETVPQYAEFDQVPDTWKDLWQKKAASLLRSREDETIESIYPRAGIYAEFGKIVCISCGFLQGSGDQRKLVIKSLSGDNEAQLLAEFSTILEKWNNGTGNEARYLCAHNGKEFDFPYLCRRMIINNIPLPSLLNIAGKKPWEITHLDTLELWKFGDFKNYTSLNLLATALSIPTPKDDIDGSMVWEVYWKERNLDRIVTYCQKDVITLARIFLRLQSEPGIDEHQVEFKK
ncbi:3'-5' exonuclease [Nostoc ellipsosporum NOK]|nr:3'-5' exonuclease [Nostoc ellipsosporum NOK]